MTTVLESKYFEPTRPYSQDELTQMRHSLYRNLHLGKKRVHHSGCNHFYLVKRYGRKEKEMTEQGTDDVGNCSVCWKIHKTPTQWVETAIWYVNSYHETFFENPKYLTYRNVDIENVYYRWLHEDFKIRGSRGRGDQRRPNNGGGGEN